MTRFPLWILLCTALWSGSTAFAATFVVTTTADAGPGSLRQAILDANAAPGADDIHFNIGGGGPQVIAVASALPNVTDPVVIDGTTQPGFTATPIITLDGNDLLADGLVVLAPSTIRGLVIVDFGNNGITVVSTGTTIVGNYIGVDASGAAADGNQGHGIQVWETVDGVVIGGPGALDRNVISANVANGIQLSGFLAVAASDNNTIQGNIIGLDAAGMNDLGNGFNGVAVDGGSNNLIVGNLIAGNTSFGIRISALNSAFNATGNTVQGNRIGTNGAGTAAVPNGLQGVALFGPQQTTVGGAVAGAGNLISGNGADGIIVSSGGDFPQVPAAGTVIAGNRIGTDVTGTAALPNGGDGISVSGGAVGNQFLGNSIDLNGGLGIDLADDGPTANDAGDPDTGPNRLQNHPVLTAVTVAGSTTVTGTLNSTPARTFRVEFFNSPAADPSGFGEGRTFLGFITVTTDAGGNTAIAATLPPIPAGTVMTATATDLTTGDTSEFSNAVAPAFVSAIPTLSEWMLLLLAALLACGGWIALRR